MSGEVCDRGKVICRGHSSVYKYGADGPVGTSKWTHPVHRENSRSGAEERQAPEMQIWESQEPAGNNRSLRRAGGTQGKCLVRDEKTKGRMSGFMQS